MTDSDRQDVLDAIRFAWETTDLPQTQFAALLRDEADLYETAPETATSDARNVEWGDLTDVPNVVDDTAVIRLRGPQSATSEFGLDAKACRVLADSIRLGAQDVDVRTDDDVSDAVRTALDLADDLHRFPDLEADR